MWHTIILYISYFKMIQQNIKLYIITHNQDYYRSKLDNFQVIIINMPLKAFYLFIYGCCTHCYYDFYLFLYSPYMTSYFLKTTLRTRIQNHPRQQNVFGGFSPQATGEWSSQLQTSTVRGCL